LTFYAMLAGCDAYGAATYDELSGKIMLGAFVPLSERAPHIPSALSDVIARAIDRAPEARFPSALAFASAIEAALAEIARAEAIEAARAEAARIADESLIAPLAPRDREPIAARKVERTWAKVGLVVSAGALACSLVFIATRTHPPGRAARPPVAPPPLPPAAHELASIAPPTPEATEPTAPARDRLRLKVARAAAPPDRAVPEAKLKRPKPARARANESRRPAPASAVRDADEGPRAAASSKPPVTIGSM
jgi:eukaryotic-like serine/threonine-protein kinase